MRSWGGRAFTKFLITLAELPDFNTRSDEWVEESGNPEIKISNIGAIDGSEEIHESFGVIQDPSKLLLYEGGK